MYRNYICIMKLLINSFIKFLLLFFCLSCLKRSSNFVLVQTTLERKNSQKSLIFCPIPKNRIIMTPNTSKAEAIANRSFEMICANLSRSYNVTWTFNGVIIPRKREERFYNSFVRFTDSGNYTCTRNKHTFFLKLVVLIDEPYCGPPTMVSVCPESNYALPGHTQSWKCRGYVGRPRQDARTSVTFIRAEDGDIVMSEQPQTTIGEDGQLTSHFQLTMHTPPKEQKFFCVISNNGYQTRVPFYFKYGVPPAEYSSGLVRAAVWVSCACAVLISIIAVSWRCRRNIALHSLKYRRRKGDERNMTVQRSCDLFFIYGDDSETWLLRYVVAALEAQTSYTCHLPTRDSLAGQGVFDHVTSMMASSRRVIVVISSGLLESHWAAMATRFAADAALQCRRRVICLLLQSICSLPKQENMLKSALCSLTCIRIPQGSLTSPSLPLLEEFYNKANKSTSTITKITKVSEFEVKSYTNVQDSKMKVSETFTNVFQENCGQKLQLEKIKECKDSFEKQNQQNLTKLSLQKEVLQNPLIAAPNRQTCLLLEHDVSHSHFREVKKSEKKFWARFFQALPSVDS